MSLSLNRPKLDNLAGEIWKSAERLRGKYKAYEYKSVILPIIVIRRLECVLLAWRETKRAEVLAKRPKLAGKELDRLVKDLETSNAPFGEQAAIHAFLDEKIGEMTRIFASITAQIETLTAYRKSLIHECVTGQRRVTEEDLQRTACALEHAS